MTRSLIPPKLSLEALRAFEAAARLGSFTAAALELGLTQSAISQRIKSLELSLGSSLFRRLTRSIQLTPDGERLFGALNSGFTQIGAAIEGIERQRDSTPIRLAVSVSVAARWLLPRLDGLAKRHPQLAIEILADDRLYELGVEADVALRFGTGRYPGLRSARLAGDDYFPVCSPGFLASRPEGEWRRFPRLVDSSADSDDCGGSWSEWASAVGTELGEPASRLNFSHTHLAIDAAARGMGICLARRLLVADMLASGELVRIGPRETVPTRYAYYSVTAGPVPERLKILNGWLKKAIAETLT